MIKVNHKFLFTVSGLVWLGIGCMLMSLGIKLLMVHAVQPDASNPLVGSLGPYMGGVEQAALLLLVICLMIGFFKGRYLLGKSAQREMARIRTFPQPTNFFNIYSAKYYILLGAMICLGMGIKFLGLPPDVRGFVDVAIGSALINGAMVYFRQVIA